MKRKLIFGAAFFCIMWGFTACEDILDCKFCRNVTYENGVVVNEGPEVEYCGAELIAKEATPDVTVGSLTTKVVCR
jgi:hypothetical protein